MKQVASAILFVVGWLMCLIGSIGHGLWMLGQRFIELSFIEDK